MRSRQNAAEMGLIAAAARRCCSSLLLLVAAAARRCCSSLPPLRCRVLPLILKTSVSRRPIRGRNVQLTRRENPPLKRDRCTQYKTACHSVQVASAVRVFKKQHDLQTTRFYL